ncbi:roadblock/LC7 domain-containing protein [Ruegeria sp. HKCCD8929]|uniref:roadblock/LC7 domain-containing protein n=1 Tax=Ruegeria sp. HKCCD8929 TaxID=2683006 RepID=UPI0020C49526|nr:roadblock/LC7 domain-containing protein [Ruegeria sp. HKCCD8929]
MTREKTGLKTLWQKFGRDFVWTQTHVVIVPGIAPEPTEQLLTKPPTKTEDAKEKLMSTDISKLSEIKGIIGACLVDSDTGLMLASEGGGKLDLEAAGAANVEVVRAKLAAIETLGLNDSIEDILITLGKQYHLIRPLDKNPTIFIYAALDKKTANLGLARIQVKAVESGLSI